MDNSTWLDKKKLASHILLSPHFKLSACNFVMYHPRLACNWRFQQISVCFWGYSCTMLMVFLHTTDAKVLSRHAVPKYRLGQYGVGRLLEWALYTFSIFLYPISCRFTSYNTYCSKINPQNYTIYWWDNMAWADNKKWVSHSLLSPHSKLSACSFVI